jgi:hypothetical protein
VKDLNEALEELGGAALKDSLEGVIDRLRDHGIRGLQVVEDGEHLALSVTSGELIASLDAIADGVDLERTVSAALEALENGVATAGGWDTSSPGVQTVLLDSSRAQLVADQTASSLLFVRSSLQPPESAPAAQKNAMKAYNLPA